MSLRSFTGTSSTSKCSKTVFGVNLNSNSSRSQGAQTAKTITNSEKFCSCQLLWPKNFAIPRTNMKFLRNSCFIISTRLWSKKICKIRIQMSQGKQPSQKITNKKLSQKKSKKLCPWEKSSNSGKRIYLKTTWAKSTRISMEWNRWTITTRFCFMSKILRVWPIQSSGTSSPTFCQPKSVPATDPADPASANAYTATKKAVLAQIPYAHRPATKLPRLGVTFQKKRKNKWKKRSKTAKKWKKKNKKKCFAKRKNSEILNISSSCNTWQIFVRIITT